MMTTNSLVVLVDLLPQLFIFDLLQTQQYKRLKP